MSRIGNKPVPIADGVKVSVAGRQLNVEGPVGKLDIQLRPEVDVTVKEESKEAIVSRKGDDRIAKAMHGLTRALLNNMIIGVKEGYEKNLELQGVGYVCNLQGDTLSLRVGLANELKKKIPVGLDVTCPDQTHIKVKGCDKQKVGQFAAEVRALRKPEPYKGKGIRYLGEHVKIKPGKAAKQ
ncbi:50S ribosomal protein L6 [Mariniblastus fucicola]|uniref:Large ribosomal subunit protein uL6 n=1 Tax=Mariniblastus fucicola TaxID=980251 RepID=A0A5B9P912_9BACT|nr:50S ribosomal protein L6 [Mariniblastus fucicola]QEG21412.1 50S ribosomal protein L6 [Mariniblastus fucicola]